MDEKHFVIKMYSDHLHMWSANIVIEYQLRVKVTQQKNPPRKLKSHLRPHNPAISICLVKAKNNSSS